VLITRIALTPGTKTAGSPGAPGSSGPGRRRCHGAMTAQTRGSAHWVVMGRLVGLACASRSGSPGRSGHPWWMRAGDRRRGPARRTFGSAIRTSRSDNGQHLLLAHARNHPLMRLLGVDPHQTLLSLPFMGPVSGRMAARSGSLPAPLHPRVRWGPARAACVARPPALAAWVARQRRSRGSCPSIGRWRRCWPRSRHDGAPLWRPLCIAAMNAEPAQASVADVPDLLRLSHWDRRAGHRLLLTTARPVSTMARSGTAVPRAGPAPPSFCATGDRAGRSGHGWSVQLREQRCRPTRCAGGSRRAGGAPAGVGLDRGAAAGDQ